MTKLDYITSNVYFNTVHQVEIAWAVRTWPYKAKNKTYSRNWQIVICISFVQLLGVQPTAPKCIYHGDNVVFDKKEVSPLWEWEWGECKSERMEGVQGTGYEAFFITFKGNENRSFPYLE